MAALSPGTSRRRSAGSCAASRTSRCCWRSRADRSRPAKQLDSPTATLAYDYLIVAAGATHAYFGHDEWRHVAPGLKTLEDALEIRRRVLLAFERAEREPDAARRRALLTFVVVGGGPTGVELAGALAEIAQQSLARDFRHFDPGVRAHPARSRRGPRCSRRSRSRCAHRRAARPRTARRRGADRAGRSRASAPGRVEWAPRRIEAETVLWAAGVAASPLGATLGAPLDRAGRVPHPAGPDDPRPSRRVRHRRPGLARRRRTASRCRASRRSRSRWGSTPPRTSRARSSTQPLRAVPLPRPRQHGDDRPRVGGRRLRAGCS